MTPDIDQSVAGMVVMMYREVTRKWLSWWASARPTC